MASVFLQENMQDAGLFLRINIYIYSSLIKK